MLAVLMNLGFAGGAGVAAAPSSNIVRSVTRTRKRPLFYNFIILTRLGLVWKSLAQ